MNELAFDRLPWLGPLLFAVAGTAAVGVYGVWQRRRALRAFAELRLLPRLAPSIGWGRGLVRIGLVGAVLLAITAAVIGPRWGEREQKVFRRGVDVMVLLDVSRSMLARDIAPSRIERAKIAISQDLLPKLGGDRVGLITFAGVATLKCPLTNDYGFFRLALDEVGPETAVRGGTLIGDAIRKAGESFPKNLDTHRIVVLVTDGEDQDSFPVDAAAALWRDHKIPIIAIALGDEREGARVPLKTTGGENYLEYKGQTVWSRADFSQLREVAAAGELGVFVPAGTKDFDLGAIYERVIGGIQVQRREETERAPLPSQYHPFALAALALLLADSCLRAGPRRVARVA
ncbi:MAG: VWA domain-containing protein [Phycisphaerae bacterium]